MYRTMDKNEFEQKWLEGTNILQRLPYTGQDIVLFKTITLEELYSKYLKLGSIPTDISMTGKLRVDTE